MLIELCGETESIIQLMIKMQQWVKIAALQNRRIAPHNINWHRRVLIETD